MSKKLLEPGLPRGFEDSFGKSLVIEKKIKEVIEKIFLRYGYTEIKTSPFEYSENIGGFLTDDLNDFPKIFLHLMIKIEKLVFVLTFQHH